MLWLRSRRKARWSACVPNSDVVALVADPQHELTAGKPDAGTSPRVVLFDFDGVLVRGDAFESFLRERLRRQWWRLLLALPVLPLMLPLLGFGRGQRIGARFFVRLGLLGSSPQRLRRQLDRWARDRARIPGVFLRDGVFALRRHIHAGDRVIVVTGCEETLARGLLAGIALADVEVIGSELGSGWIGARARWHNVGRNKPIRLAQLGITAPWAVAYSDSSRDTPMLRDAHDAVLVNAGTELCRKMERRLGRPLRRVDWR